jgi:hypothetical protein
MMNDPITTNAMLHAEDAATIERLERELAAANRIIDSNAEFIKQLGDTCKAAEKEAIALREDAERYRWLANKVLACDYGDNASRGEQVGWRICGVWRDGKPLMFGPSIAAAIDAARLPSAPG